MKFYHRDNYGTYEGNEEDIEDENFYRRERDSECDSSDDRWDWGSQPQWFQPPMPQWGFWVPSCPPSCPWPRPCPKPKPKPKPKPCPPRPIVRADGAIIPYASGTTPVAITTLSTALPATGFVSAIGFGETQNGITIAAGGELILSTGNMAFVMPRNGTITAIRAFFTNIVPVTLNTSVLQISAQLYFAEPNSNVFRPLDGTRVNLEPTLTGNIPVNSTFTGSERNLKIRVERGTRLLLVFFASITGAPAAAFTITGTASAGVNII
jgi:BclB C-terminal domain-containing protein